MTFPSDPANFEAAAYVHALLHLPHIGPQACRHVLQAYPRQETLLNASDADMSHQLNRKLAALLRQGMGEWQNTWTAACEAMARHVEKGVTLLPITSDEYPALLKLIPDPPLLLYTQGSPLALSQLHAVAVVGTREPTESGRMVARRIARFFAEKTYVIVSGLAKGIDTAAHNGALDAHGMTVAVLGTPLNHIYPAENAPLARRIVDEGGVLVSEYPFGHQSFKGGFVQRDRIQSGLSLAVIPVQTRVDGGTMHTVNSAFRQQREVFCPLPIVTEPDEPEYQGIYHILAGGQASPFDEKDYATILARLDTIRRRLSDSLGAAAQPSSEPPTQAPLFPTE